MRFCKSVVEASISSSILLASVMLKESDMVNSGWRRGGWGEICRRKMAGSSTKMLGELGFLLKNWKRITKGGGDHPATPRSQHAYRDGRLEEVILRHLDADDGSTVIAKSIRLSDFLGRMDL
ncbi:E3 ubiquitin-protein ligase makorin [Zea mays]|uniref:E3 ubiquitin-protein ligase makorin n=1 Tax=Zea mays TaxID=4577 RepID=A0A1D6NZP5_MAIZE|nr:E3 ubiquitin-protein ligase makorin [Zea mays]